MPFLCGQGAGSPSYDPIIIDTGGRDTTSQRAALTVADALLVPFLTRSFDAWALEKASSTPEGRGPGIVRPHTISVGLHKKPLSYNIKKNNRL